MAHLWPGSMVPNFFQQKKYPNSSPDIMEQAGVYLSRVHHERDLPKLQLSKGITKNEYNQVVIPNFTDILIEGYDPLPPISAPLSVGK